MFNVITLNDKYIRKIIYEANQLYNKYDLDKNINFEIFDRMKRLQISNAYKE